MNPYEESVRESKVSIDFLIQYSTTNWAKIVKISMT